MGDYIRERVCSLESLPTFPTIVGEVMSVIDDPKSSVSDLVKKMDPSLVGEVLKVANSAYFGRRNFRRISTVEQAVATIGYSGLSHIVLQTPFLSILQGSDDLFDRKAFVHHSLAAATLARTVSFAYNLGNPNRAYVSGMLHDIGVIVIYEHFKEEWKRIDELIENDHLLRVEAEKRVLNATHAEVGAILLEKWDLPEAVITSVRLHHDGEAVREDEEAYVTWLANTLARAIDFEKDMEEFQAFFDRQRELLLAEMPERYLLKNQVEHFEKAFDHLKGAQALLEGNLEEKDD
jgi:putative nucleotidyltransferase with HDIG domain